MNSVAHSWQMRRRLGANVVRESWMSRRTKKYFTVLVFYSRHGERWKDVHENEPALKVYTTKLWRSSCFQFRTQLTAEPYFLFSFIYLSWFVLFQFFFLFVNFNSSYFSKREGNIGNINRSNSFHIRLENEKKGVIGYPSDVPIYKIINFTLRLFVFSTKGS